MLILLKTLRSIRNLEGHCLQRLEVSETSLGAASDSPPLQSCQSRFFAMSNVMLRFVPYFFQGRGAAARAAGSATNARIRG